MLNRFFSFFIIAFSLAFFSCKSKDNTTKKVETDKQQVVSSDTLEINNSQNNFYRVLAGLDNSALPNDSSLVTDYNNQWLNMKSRLLDPIKQWKTDELPSACQETKTLFYPFSGPDFIIPNTIFPNVENIVMFGLEVPGIDVSKTGNSFASRLVPKMKTSLRDYFGKSYFITKNMIQDLNKDSLNGVTPLIGSFIVRSGYNIISIKNFILDSSGKKFYTEKPEDLVSNSYATKGVEFIYTNDLRTKRSLNYLAFNAENANLEKHKEIELFLQENVSDQTTAYLKSASYLLHYSAFSRVRDLCLKKAKYLLQDDTGVAYRFLANEWDCRVFGSYVKPIADFSGVYQTDLDSLYRTNKVNSTLPFNMGYHYFTGKQNLLFAQKK
jgi:hypothetical protein